jgi:hypothetical protein
MIPALKSKGNLRLSIIHISKNWIHKGGFEKNIA